MSAQPPDPRLSPAPTALRRGRFLLLAWLVWHGFASVVSIARQLPPAKAIRVATGPYERTLGVYQSWNMFVPNAPRESEWLVATGRTADGTDRDVPVMVGDLPPDRIEWFYRRAGKLERNVGNEDLGALRRGWAWWACRREAAQGRVYETILLQRAERDTPPPDQRATTPRDSWPVRRTRLSRQACPELEPAASPPPGAP